MKRALFTGGGSAGHVLPAVPVMHLRLMGGTCLAGDPVAGPSIVSQLNILILPTLLAYSAYNTLEFRRKRDRMDADTGRLFKI